MSTEKVKGSLDFTCCVECPHCAAYVDLFSIQAMNDDAYLHLRLFGPNAIGNDDLDEEIYCPKCHKSFMVGEIEY